MPRFIYAFGLAFLITAGLFLGMRYLILGTDAQLNEPIKGNVLDFIRLKKDETVETKQRKPKKPPKPEEPPPEMQQPPMQAESNASEAIPAFSSGLQAQSGLEGGLSLNTTDGEYFPITPLQPPYPRRAQQRGIEGYAIVEFTITKAGNVKNVSVLESEPEGVFDRVSMDTAKKFKFKPRVVDGKPEEVHGVPYKFTFTMKS